MSTASTNPLEPPGTSESHAVQERAGTAASSISGLPSAADLLAGKLPSRLPSHLAMPCTPTCMAFAYCAVCTSLNAGIRVGAKRDRPSTVPARLLPPAKSGRSGANGAALRQQQKGLLLPPQLKGRCVGRLCMVAPPDALAVQQRAAVTLLCGPGQMW